MQKLFEKADCSFLLLNSACSKFSLLVCYSSSSSSSSNVSCNEEDYSTKRARNNAAVKKSREKAKCKKLQYEAEVDELEGEISEMEKRELELDEKIESLKKLITDG